MRGQSLVTIYLFDKYLKIIYQLFIVLLLLLSYPRKVFKA